MREKRRVAPPKEALDVMARLGAAPKTRGDVRELARERAAIMEVDGGLPQSQAESETLAWLLAELGEKVLGVDGLFEPHRPDGKNRPDQIPF